MQKNAIQKPIYIIIIILTIILSLLKSSIEIECYESCQTCEFGRNIINKN